MIAVISPVEETHAEGDHKRAVRQNIQLFFEDYLMPCGYDYISQKAFDGESIRVRPYTEPGVQESVAEHLQKTRDGRRKHIEALAELVEANAIDDLIHAENFAYHARRTSEWAESHINTLFDGTTYSRGRAILCEDEVDHVIEQARDDDMTLYLAEFGSHY